MYAVIVTASNGTRYPIEFYKSLFAAGEAFNRLNRKWSKVDIRRIESASMRTDIVPESNWDIVGPIED